MKDQRWKTEFLEEKTLHFLVRFRNKSFTIKELHDETGVGEHTILKYLRSREDVKPTLVRKDGYVKRWESHVAPPPSTPDGILELYGNQMRNLDDLGRQARADFEWTKTRGRGGRGRIIKKF